MDLFAFLRAGVRSGDTPDIGGSTDDRWRELYTAASSQGVSALVWDGIRRLPPELQPSRELRLRWAYSVAGQRNWLRPTPKREFVPSY